MRCGLQLELKPAQPNRMKTKTKLEKRIADGIRNGDDKRWGSLDELEHLYGITRSCGYFLIAEGKIKSRLIRFKHSKGTGRRLVDFRSVEAFLDSCPTDPTQGISRRMRTTAITGVAMRDARKDGWKRKGGRK